MKEKRNLLKQKMEKANADINTFIINHAFISAAAMAVIMTGMYYLVSYLFSMLPAVQTDVQIHSAALVIVYYGIPLMFALSFGCGWIFYRGSFFKTLGIGAFVILYATFAFLVGVGQVYYGNVEPIFLESSMVGDRMIQLLGIGFFEEVTFRGIIANKLGQKLGKDIKGVWTAAIVSSLLFGAAHMLNIFRGAGLMQCIVQAVVAFATGLVFTAIYYRGGSIWAIMLIHSFLDAGPLFSSFFTQNGGTTADVINTFTMVNLFPAIPMFLLVLWLLRPSRMPEIIYNLQNRYPKATFSLKSHRRAARTRSRQYCTLSL